MCDVCHCQVDRRRIETYNQPLPWVEFQKPIVGFKYEVVGQPKEERFYGVGCKTWWYQWNCPNENGG